MFLVGVDDCIHTHELYPTSAGFQLKTDDVVLIIAQMQAGLAYKLH